MKKQDGLTAIEIVMSVVVLVIVATVALPQLTTMQRKTVLAKNSLEMVKSSYANAIADIMAFPTASELSEYVDASKVLVKEDGSGLKFEIDAQRLQVVTYVDGDCSVPTSTPYEQVQCIGDVSFLE